MVKNMTWYLSALKPLLAYTRCAMGDLYEMELHDELQVCDTVWATRVPGGWVYTTIAENGTGGLDSTSCFVPFDNEFQGGMGSE